MVWKCPNCQLPLERALLPQRESPHQLICAQMHTFDFAKQGYVNLLLDNQKRSKNPGDSQDMLEARRRFLSAGYYDVLIEAIQPYLQPSDLNNHHASNINIVDLGCGEGYYLSQLVENSAVKTVQGYGIDIAKVGVRKAAQHCKTHTINCEFAVASTYRIPLLDNSMDVAISIFAPFDPQEVARVLKSEGVLIRVSPGARHLLEIKERLYQKALQHEPPAEVEHFEIVKTLQITNTHSMSGTAIIHDLIPMTPLHWQGSVESKTSLEQEESVQVTFDFQFEVLATKVST